MNPPRRTRPSTTMIHLLLGLAALVLGSSSRASAQSIVWMRGGHTNVVNAVAFSPIAPVLASAGDDRTVRLWDPATGEQLRVCGLKSAGQSLAYMPDGGRLLVGCYDGTVQVLDPLTLETVSSFRAHASIVLSVSVTADGSRILTAGESAAKLWSADDASLLQTYVGHTTTVGCGAISPDGRYVLTGGTDYTIRLWDAETGEQLRSIVEVMKPVSAVAFSPDSRTFAAQGYSLYRDTFAINIYSVPSCVPTTSFEVKQQKEITGLAFTSDGSGLASISMDFETLPWMKTFSTIEVHAVSGERGAWEYHDTLEGSCIAFSEDDQWMAYGSFGGWIGVIRRSVQPTSWFTDTMRHITEYAGAVTALRLSPDERILAVGDDAGHVHLRSPSTGTMIRRLVGHYKPVRSIDFTPDGQRLASGGVDGIVKIWDVGTGELQRRLFLSPSAIVHGVRFLDAGRRFAGALGPPDSSIAILDTSSNEFRARLVGSGGVLAIALTAGHDRLISASEDGVVRSWDLVSASECAPRIQFDRPVLSLDVSSRNVIVCGMDDGGLAMIEYGYSRPIWEMRHAHSRAITAVTFARDGSLVGTCSADSTARIWRVEAEGLTLVRTYSNVPFAHRSMAIALDSGLVLNGIENATVLARRLADPVSVPRPTVLATTLRIAPNPARSAATIEFDNERAGSCTIRFTDLLGRTTGNLLQRDLGAGPQHLRFPVSTLAPGTWVLELQTPSRRERVRLVIAQ